MHGIMKEFEAKSKPDLSKFNWEDALLLDGQLTNEEKLLRDSAASYAQDKLQPRVIGAYGDERADKEIFTEMGNMGLLGVTGTADPMLLNTNGIAVPFGRFGLEAWPMMSL